MKRTFFHLVFLFSILVLVGAGLWSGTGLAAQWQSKVAPQVLENASQAGASEFIIVLARQADLSAAGSFNTKLEKGTYVYKSLSRLAAETQAPLLGELTSLGAEYHPYWVVNAIWVRGDMRALQALAQRPEVAFIYPNQRLELGSPPETGSQPLSPSNVEWNIALVGAPDVWAQGFTGQGVVIGGQDTGYDWDHPGLIGHYRGWDGRSSDHNYNWHDAILSGGGACGADSPEPCDDYGHGTHTMGIMVGDDGLGNQTGMAPGAKWIGCRNMDQGVGSYKTYMECYQWFIAPTDLNGANPDPAKAPHVINNSWSCPPSTKEDCDDPDILLAVVQNVRAAGILTVHSAGNSGPACESVNEPAAIYDESFTVGSTTSLDTISSFSSRGPVTVDGSNRLKPDIAAPGSVVRSTQRGGGYISMSGTSMAAPHVAGLAALLISANPTLAGQVDMLESIIQQSALPMTTTETCGGVPGSQIPNNTFGWGRIDALAAFRAVERLTISKRAWVESINPGEVLTYTLSVTHTQGLTLTHNGVLTDTIPEGTAFLTATLPHTFDGSTLAWTLPALDVGDVFSVTLVVQAQIGTGKTITNRDYGVRSDGIAPAGGTPVTTSVVYKWKLYFPLVGDQ